MKNGKMLIGVFLLSAAPVFALDTRTPSLLRQSGTTVEATAERRQEKELRKEQKSFEQDVRRARLEDQKEARKRQKELRKADLERIKELRKQEKARHKAEDKRLRELQKQRTK